jgi:hypothetical protein
LINAQFHDRDKNHGLRNQSFVGFFEHYNVVLKGEIIRMAKINISAGNISLEAEILDTPTASKILEALPLESSANVWGDEIYFDIPLRLEQEPDARADVEVGDLAYWPAGPAFCIFFGPTPVSTGDQPRAYSPVNVFGRVLGDARQFKGISSGTAVMVTKVS